MNNFAHFSLPLHPENKEQWNNHNTITNTRSICRSNCSNSALRTVCWRARCSPLTTSTSVGATTPRTIWPTR